MTEPVIALGLFALVIVAFAILCVAAYKIERAIDARQTLAQRLADEAYQMQLAAEAAPKETKDGRQAD